MKKNLLILFGILVLLISCKQNKTRKTEISEQEPTTELKTNKKNKLTGKSRKAELKNNHYNLNSVIDFQGLENVEIGQINDPDGFTNLRKEGSIKSEILTKISDDEYFFYESKNQKWLKVKDLKGNVGFIHKSRVSKVIDTNLYSMTFNDYDKKTETEFRKDTIVNFDYLEKFFENNYSETEFNYRKFKPLKDGLSHKDTLAIYKDTISQISVLFSKSKFNPKKHQIEHDNTFVKKIDGQKFWGTDGGIPRYQFDDIKIIRNETSYSIPQSKINYLFNPNIEPNYVEVLKPNDDRLIIKMANGDGAGAYAVVFIFKKEKLLKSIIYFNF